MCAYARLSLEERRRDTLHSIRVTLLTVNSNKNKQKNKPARPHSTSLFHLFYREKTELNKTILFLQEITRAIKSKQTKRNGNETVRGLNGRFFYDFFANTLIHWCFRQ